MTFEVGRVLRGYRIEDVKNGGMGAVYIARHLAEPTTGEPQSRGSGQLVALKTIETSDYLLDRSDDGFAGEGLIWASIPSHPYIVECFGVDRFEQSPVIILEYMAGGSLADHITKRTMTFVEALRIFREVCSAMEFLKACDVPFHRDIKPDNILMTNSGTAKITDFGLASRQGPALSVLRAEPVAEPSPVRSKIFGGTLPYMSPEHFGESIFTAASDVYSFGVVMFEVMTGERLFDEVDTSALHYAHLMRSPDVRLRKVRHPAMSALISKCIEKDPKNRFQDFAELDGALADVIKEQGIDVPEPASLTIEQAEREMNPGSWAVRGHALSTLQRGKESLRCYQRAFELDPTRVGSSSNVGQALARLGRRDEAIAYYVQEVEMRPNFPGAHFVFGQFLQAGHKFDESVTEFVLACKGDPKNVAFQRKLALTYYKLGRTDESKQTVAIVMNLVAGSEHRHQWGWENEGIHFALGNDFQTSLQMLDRCVEDFPGYAGGWYNRSVTLLFMERYDESLRSVSTALSVSDDLPHGRFLAGLIYFYMKDEHWTAEWTQLLTDWPNHHLAKSVNRLLGSLRSKPATEWHLIMRGFLLAAASPNSLYYR